MKHTRFAVYAAGAIVLLFALLTVSGCGGGGKLTNGTTTQWYGSLQGVETTPPDPDNPPLAGEDATDVPLNTLIFVYWPHDGYPPPHVFYVTLEKQETLGNWGAIHTKGAGYPDTDPGNGQWAFQTNGNFSPYTWYRIVIKAEGETTRYVYFETGDWLVGAGPLSRSAASAPNTATTKNGYRAADPAKATGEDALTHMITAPSNK